MRSIESSCTFFDWRLSQHSLRDSLAKIRLFSFDWSSSEHSTTDFWMGYFCSFIAFCSFSHSPIDSWTDFSCLSFPFSSSLRSSMDSWMALNSLSLDSSSVSYVFILWFYWAPPLLIKFFWHNVSHVVELNPISLLFVEALLRPLW